VGWKRSQGPLPDQSYFMIKISGTAKKVSNMRDCATKGAIQEYKIAVMLMEKGYQVYKALSPSSNPDLMAYKDGRFIKLEVRTGKQYKDMTYVSGDGDYDILVIVTDKGITFIPELP
jgi:hypothetical protein